MVIIHEQRLDDKVTQLINNNDIGILKNDPTQKMHR
jgi:hypothetical protein